MTLHFICVTWMHLFKALTLIRLSVMLILLDNKFEYRNWRITHDFIQRNICMHSLCSELRVGNVDLKKKRDPRCLLVFLMLHHAHTDTHRETHIFSQSWRFVLRRGILCKWRGAQAVCNKACIMWILSYWSKNHDIMHTPRQIHIHHGSPWQLL